MSDMYSKLTNLYAWSTLLRAWEVSTAFSPFNVHTSFNASEIISLNINTLFEPWSMADPWLYPRPHPFGPLNRGNGDFAVNFPRPRFDFYRGLDGALSSQCLSAFYSSWTNYRGGLSAHAITAMPIISTEDPIRPIPMWSFTANPPCCSKCWITCDGAEVLYWPAGSFNRSYSTLRNSDGLSL